MIKYKIESAYDIGLFLYIFEGQSKVTFYMIYINNTAYIIKIISTSITLDEDGSFYSRAGINI